MADNEPVGTGGLLRGWLGIISALLTIALTGLNAYWSHKISEFESGLKLREAKLKEQQLDLEGKRDRLARYAFVHTLFGGVLNQDIAQKTLTVNLITLALARLYRVNSVTSRSQRRKCPLHV
jgi:hypothetical protein